MTESRALFSDGSAYERSMGRWSQLVAQRFLTWLALLPGLDWLDGGCGNGAFTEVIVRQCAPSTIHAFDPSQAQIDFAARRQGCSMAQFRTGDAQHIPYCDSQFDAAVMGLVISFIADPSRAIAELARVTRPGGCVATYMWDTQNGGHPANPVNAAIKAMGIARSGAPHNASANIDRMRELWITAGLVNIETSVVRIPVTYSDFDDFWQSNIISTGPLGQTLQSLEPHQTRELQDRLRKDLMTGNSGAISYEAFANAVKGEAPS